MTQTSFTVVLAPEPEAASLAGTLVADACLAWRLLPLLHPARRVMSELVLNAVEHAGTGLVVTVTQREDRLRLTVADGDPRLPRLRVPGPVHGGAPFDVRGHGLQAVQAMTAAWGAEPTTSGKVVWADLVIQPDLSATPGGGR
jgi:anti-sigma regulatory factor (Ser/Thr protein kinase)